jgi:hypothetical protein
MFLSSRQTHLAPGTSAAGVEWAAELAATATSIIGQAIQVWSSVHSPRAGTIAWTSWYPDLTSLEMTSDKLRADPGYVELATEGARYIDAPVDDAIVRPLYGAVDPDRVLAYASSVSCVVASGQFERATAAGVALSRRSEEITGLSSMFLQLLTGPYGSVGWVTGYESISEYQAAQDALHADRSFVTLLDTTAGCFLDEPTATPSVLYRRVA